jgi:hypothetical protein
MPITIDLPVKDEFIKQLLQKYLTKQAEIFLEFLNSQGLLDSDVEIEELEDQESLLNTEEDEKIVDLLRNIR